VKVNNEIPDAYKIPAGLKLPVFLLLILAGIFLELVVHYYYGIPVVYTHFYYLIIVIAGLWYGKKAIGIAIFFGGMHIAVSWLGTGTFQADSVIRAMMLVIVAAVVGIIVDRMNRYRDRVIVQNRELKNVNAQLEISENAYRAAHKKLNLLSGITRHEIRNQLTALLLYLGLSRQIAHDPELVDCITNEELAADNILRQLEFTRMYEELGAKDPQWQDVGKILCDLRPAAEKAGAELLTDTQGLLVLADPLFPKIFENLLDNSFRHGEKVSRITVTCMRDRNDLILMYRDNGAGIMPGDKERIFLKGFGKNTGLGLFLIREILEITGLSIAETGIYGSGASFEIRIPEGWYKNEPGTVTG